MLFERAPRTNSYTIDDDSDYAGYKSSKGVTKAFAKHKISVIPELGFEIASITFDTSKADYGLELTRSSWENTASVVRGGTGNTDKVTVTPTNGNRIVGLTLSGAVWFETITIHYDEVADVAWNLATDSYSYCGGTPKAEATSGTKYESLTWLTAINPANVDDPDAFTEIDNSNKAALLNSTKLVPGYKLSFAARLTVSEGSPTNASFYLKKYTSTQLLNRFALTSASASSGNPIRIEDAVKICTSINTSGWFFGSNLNQFDFDDTVAADVTTTDTGGNFQTRFFNSEAVGSAYSPDELGTFENFTGLTIYFFFTIEFADDSSVNCQEYTAVSGTVTGKPRNDYEPATTFDDEEKYYTKSGNSYVYNAGDQPTDQDDIDTGNYYLPNNRYFLKDTPGETSNCYAGLTFQINKIELTLS